MEQVINRSQSTLILMGYYRLTLPTMPLLVHGVAHGVCPPRMNGLNFKKIVFGHGLTTTTKQVSQDMWLQAKAAMLHFFCLQQVVVMPINLTRKVYTDITGRARSSEPQLTVALPTSCNLPQFMPSQIGITPAIMALLCVVCVIPKQQGVWASHHLQCGNDAY